MIASDIHDEEADDFALSVFIAECDRKQPDIIVLNGDIFDEYEFSKYGKDPRKIRMKERFDYVHDRVFGPLRKVCPNAQIDFIMGNHELRIITHLADKSPNMRVYMSDVLDMGFSELFRLDRHEINWVSKFNLGVFTKSDAKNEVNKNYQVYFDSYVVCHEPDARLQKTMSGTNGHHHKASMVTEANYTMGSTSWVQTPAIHKTDADYLTKFPGWNKGFLEVVINTAEKQVSQNIRQCHDTWAEIDGIYYEKKDLTLSVNNVI